MAASLPIVVRRTLFRSMARLSKNGQWLDVFPFASLRALSVGAKLSITSTLQHGLSGNGLLRLASDRDGPGDPFTVLRETSELVQALRPDSLPFQLPALVEQGRCILPGSKCRFTFFTPAERLLVERAGGVGGSFVHLNGSHCPPVGVVVSIREVRSLPYERLILECVAGPRCRVVDSQDEIITTTGSSSGGAHAAAARDCSAAMQRRPNAPPAPRQERLRRVQAELCKDADRHAEEEEKEEVTGWRPASRDTDALRMELAARLLSPECETILHVNGMTPPLQCAERLSFFLCNLLLHDFDVERRVACLSCTDTHARLDFCRVAMDEASWASQPQRQAPHEEGEGKPQELRGQGESRPWEHVANAAINAAINAPAATAEAVAEAVAPEGRGESTSNDTRTRPSERRDGLMASKGASMLRASDLRGRAERRLKNQHREMRGRVGHPARTSQRSLAFMPVALPESGVLAVAAPFHPVVPREDRPFALKAAPPLLDAILKLDTKCAPHRIIAYQMEDGRQFNCAAFDDVSAYESYRSWFTEHATKSDGSLHKVWAARYRDRDDSLPTPDSWLWGVGHRVLSDTRSGETQIGHGHRFSRMLFRDASAKADAEQAAVDPQFEAQIAREMEEAGIAYYGRLVMAAPGGDGGWFTKSRYGSLLDAQRGTWLVREMFAKEMDRWFSSYETVTGSIASTHLVTPHWPDGTAWQREREG